MMNFKKHGELIITVPTVDFITLLKKALLSVDLMEQKYPNDDFSEARKEIEDTLKAVDNEETN